MANIDGLAGYNNSTGTNKLIAAYGNDLVDVDAGTGYGQNITSGNKAEFAVFLDRLFFQNGSNTPRTFNGTSWTTTHAAKCPTAKYIQVYGTKIYLGYISFGGTTWASRVWYSNLPKNEILHWGLMWGTNLSTIKNSPEVWSANAGFKTYGIKIGDPFFITSGGNAGQYIVSEVNSDQNLTLTENMKATASSISYWVGGNYFDVRTNDGDVITGLGENSDRLLVFKENSLHRYDGSSLRQIKGVPGTSSQRSVVNIRDYTLYFHGSETTKTGIYMYGGVSAQKISNAVQPIIDGMSASNFANTDAWREGDIYHCYIGNVSNADRDITITNCVLSYDVSANNWAFQSIPKTPKCVAYFRESSAEKTFIGDSADAIYQWKSGNSYAGTDISFITETKPYYPAGREMLIKPSRVQIYSRKGRGTSVKYRRWGMPWRNDIEWQGLGNLKHDVTEFPFPQQDISIRGIQFRFEEQSSKEPLYIEGISLFYQEEGTYARLP